MLNFALPVVGVGRSCLSLFPVNQNETYTNTNTSMYIHIPGCPSENRVGFLRSKASKACISGQPILVSLV